MFKNTNLLTVLALVLSIAALVISLAFPGKTPESPDYTAEIEALRQQNALLQSQLDALSGQIGTGSTRSEERRVGKEC